MEAMNTVFFDREASDDERRNLLYQGQLFVYSSSPSALLLSELAKELLEEAFTPHDPREAQYQYSAP